MDRLIVQARDAKESARYEGSTEEFKRSQEIVAWCLIARKIVRLLPQDMEREHREKYTNYLVELMHEYLKANPKVTTWADFASRPENSKTAALFHKFGVRGEVFGIESFQDDEVPSAERSLTRLTFEEFYEMCQVQFHYQGSFGSFKKMIAARYGSFAEYCVSRGYDINGTKWENDETAIRVAKKLGSEDAVKKRAVSLFKYLSDRGLLEAAFGKEVA